MLVQSPRHKRKRVKALTDPKPEFVSLVGAGANKTPFRALRAAQMEQDVAAAQVSSKGGYQVARIQFSDEHFADEAAVSAWLADGGYGDANIERTEGGFTASGGDIPEDTELTEIAGEGFTLFVVEAQKADDTRSEIRKRYDETLDSVQSVYDTSTSVAGVLANTKHSPPGLMDMSMAMYDAIRNSLRQGDVPAAKSAIHEFSTLFDQLLEIFPGEDKPAMKAFVDALAPEVEMTKETETAAKADDALELTPEMEAAAETAEKTEEAVIDAPVEATAEEETDEAAETDETAEKDEAASDEATAEADEAAAADETGEETAEKTEDEAAPEEEAAKSGNEDPMAALTALVGDLTQSVKALSDTVSESVRKSDELAQRVEAVEDTRQTRKGADVDETTTSQKSDERTVSEDMAELRKRSMLGMRG